MELQPGVTSKPPFNGWAVAGTIIGAISALLLFLGVWWGALGGLVALLTGLDGISKARRTGAGLGLAIAATILGGVVTALMLFVYLRIGLRS